MVKFTDNSDKVLKAASSAKEKALFEIGNAMVNKWKDKITSEGVVDTGRFRNSTDHIEEEDCTIIGSDIKDPPYPVFLELGTVKMSARPTLKPAITENISDIKKIIDNNYKR